MNDHHQIPFWSGLMIGVLLLVALVPSRSAGADTHHLRLLLRDANTQQLTAARVRVIGDQASPLLAPNASLGTHFSSRLGPYAFVADSLHLDLPPGDYLIDAVRGTESYLSQAFLTLEGDTTMVLELSDWIEPRNWGWWSGDPHVHSDHAEGAVYPRPDLDQVATAARAEGLDMLYLLDNDPSHPGGPAFLVPGESAVFWGEEFRSDFWGHVVLLGLDELLIGRGYPGCCGAFSPAWPTLSGWLDTGVFPYVHLAHPHSTDNYESSIQWPQTGFAREAPVLALDARVQAIAVGGATNAPTIWALQEYLDGLRAGSRWAAVGEGDRALDRHQVSPVGQPRTYAQLGNTIPRGSVELDPAWREAVLAGRCFASTGPVIQTLTLEGQGMGSTVSANTGSALSLHLAFASLGRLDTLVLHGANGEHRRWEWPSGRSSLDTTLTLSVAHDDFLVLDVSGGGLDWPDLEFAPRAVSAPIWIDTGNPWPVAAELPRRVIANLQQFWLDIFDDRYFETEADSLATAEDILGTAQVYEAMVDDAAPPFQILGPTDGHEILLGEFRLNWERVRSYDLEDVSYYVEIAEHPGFASLTWSADVQDTTVTVSTLPRGRTYYWRVSAIETGEPAVLATNAPSSFQLSSTAVPALPDADPFSLRSLGADSARGGFAFEVRLPTAGSLRWRVFDARGRQVRVLDRAWLPGGRSRLAWDGHDDHGRAVARGVYRTQAQFKAQRASVPVLVRD